MKKHVYSILAKREEKKNLPHPSTQNTDTYTPLANQHSPPCSIIIAYATNKNKFCRCIKIPCLCRLQCSIIYNLCVSGLGIVVMASIIIGPYKSETI